MSEQDKKALEFHLVGMRDFPNYANFETKDDAMSAIDLIKRSNEPLYIHVIEYSAYEALKQKLKLAVEALEQFKLGHEHAPDLPHIRVMGDTYGWCDFCSTKVHWGPGLAEEALAQIGELE